MAKLAKRERKSDGNIVVDLGEEVDKAIVKKVDQKLAAAGVALPKREKMAGPGERFGGYKPGGYRPGMYGWRPWYDDKRPGMGASYMAGWRELSHPHAGKMAVGGVIGLGAGVALMRVTPSIVKGATNLVHSGLAFLVGLIPVLAKPNSYTLGVAVPGAAMFGFSLMNSLFDAVGIAKPQVQGTGGMSGTVIRPTSPEQNAAKAKLMEVHNKLSGSVSGSGAVARVQARAIAG